MAQVERLAQPLLQWVLGHDVFLDLDRVGNEPAQKAIVGRGEVELQQTGPLGGGRDEAVLEHLGIARAQVLAVERGKEVGAQQHEACLGKDANLVFQSAEVDAGLSAHRGVDHAQQRGGDIDEVDTPLEGGCRHAAEVGHHASAQADDQRVARGTMLLKLLPYGGEGSEVLVGVAGLDGDGDDIAQTAEGAEPTHAVGMSVAVGDDKDAVVLTLGYRHGEVALEVGGKDYLLMLIG